MAGNTIQSRHVGRGEPWRVRKESRTIPTQMNGHTFAATVVWCYRSQRVASRSRSDVVTLSRRRPAHKASARQSLSLGLSDPPFHKKLESAPRMLPACSRRLCLTRQDAQRDPLCPIAHLGALPYCLEEPDELTFTMSGSGDVSSRWWGVLGTVCFCAVMRARSFFRSCSPVRVVR